MSPAPPDRLSRFFLGLLVLAAGPMASARGAWAVEQPQVVVQPQPSGPPGAQVTIVGRGFDDGQRVEIRWGGFDGQLIATTVGGDFTTQVTVPDARDGLHPLVVLSRDPNGVLGSATATDFTVGTKGQAAADGQPARAVATPAAEPVAGTSGAVWAAVVGPLLALALGLVWSRWRRRSCADSSPATATD